MLWRILNAAHHAASVGFMQLWSFLLIRDRPRRQLNHDHFRDVSGKAAETCLAVQNLWLAARVEGVQPQPPP